MPGPMGKRPMGGPKVKNPGKLFKRLMAYICKSYTPHCILVVICILASVLCNVQGTMFMQTLIDDYITPLLKSADPDFTPLAAAIAKVAVFYAIGAFATYSYNRILEFISRRVR